MKQIIAMVLLVVSSVASLTLAANTSLKLFLALVIAFVVMLVPAYVYLTKRLDGALTTDNQSIQEPVVYEQNYTTGNKKIISTNHEVLTSQDIAFFNEEMMILNDSLDIINKGLESSNSINRVMNKNDRMKAIKLWMESLTEEPERLIDASDFVYKQLPMLSDLIEMYLSINSKELLNGKQKLVLEESLEAMSIVSDNIKSDFFSYGQKELDSLKGKIEQVRKNNLLRKEGFDDGL